MDDKQFDILAKRVGTSRRRVLKRMIGIGGAAVAARLATTDAEAARRGYSGPSTGQSPNGSLRICTLQSPSCCIECAQLGPFSIPTWDEVQQQFTECAYDGSHTCAECVQRITNRTRFCHAG